MNSTQALEILSSDRLSLQPIVSSHPLLECVVNDGATVQVGDAVFSFGSEHASGSVAFSWSMSCF